MILLTRIFERCIAIGFWLIALSVLGFLIAVWDNPYISLSLDSWWRFIYSTFTSSYFFYHPMYTLQIAKLLLTTLELVLVSTIVSLLISLVLVTFTLKRPRLAKWIYNFFIYVRIVPFIALPLLFNQVFNDSMGTTLQVLDDANYGVFSSSRLWLIITGEGISGSRLSFLLNFLAIAATCSYYILPNTFIIVARATNQVLSYNYVKAVLKTWSSPRIMLVMVLHRLIPTLCKELPVILSTFFFFVGCLEYLFNWRGVGSLFITLLQHRDKYTFEIGVIVFLVGATMILTQAAFNLFAASYDPHKYKELPYEVD
ncbi:ABC transporter permease [Psittacicella hinzii]|uniref:ABC transmembrane type-1 domain-containing protein n=1 Tax=Psittacicella hinzii TaxID=2028575 RepID=A0A3A1YPD2_9GAMM|nr:hypothetical protein [Psittacicella hinzii]RIY40143.1 hypothetical protein CKF58_01005 [Psittacicella hinzii]